MHQSDPGPGPEYAFTDSLDGLPDGVIDFHAHIDEAHHLGWIDPPSKLLPLLDEARIAVAAVMTYRDASLQDPSPARYVADAVAAHPDRFVGFARIFPGPGTHAADLLERCVLEWGMIGLKLHPVTNLQAPADPANVRITHRAAELGVPVLFHCGDEPNCTPHAIAALARLVPEATIILGHAGGYRHVDDALDVVRECPNLMIDTSAMPYPGRIADFVGAIGPERVIFGSDGPGAPPRLEVRKVLYAGLRDDALELVLRDNAKRLIEIARSAR